MRRTPVANAASDAARIAYPADMDIRIGIKDTAREISFESSQSASDVEGAVVEALAGTVLTLDDSKGKRYLVPSAQIAYVEIGSETSRRVGFVA